MSEQLRFNHDATTHEEALNYMVNRAKQLLRFNFFLTKLTKHDWGFDAKFNYAGKTYQALYLLKQYRGQGLYEKKYDKSCVIITSYQCAIETYLDRKRIPYLSVDLEPYYEYSAIAQLYGSKKANRSGVYLMNHIDEGLAILDWINASTQAKRAYCLHPIYQGDTDLATNYNGLTIPNRFSGRALILALEYRSVANEYLSKRSIQSLDEIRLSPLKDVNDMLIADKIQNYKDFELYHKGTHPRSAELDQYFKNWLDKLGVCDERYQHYKKLLTVLGK
jgi:hypothetical protein